MTIFLTSFLISLAITPFLISISKKKKLFDFPEGDNLKIHKTHVPIFGGMAMLLAICLSLLFFGFLDARFVYTALGCFCVFFLGLWDDLKWKHISLRKPHIKFFFLIFCSLASSLFLYLAGINFYLFPFLTFFYVFILINAVNYQDGMDGQAGFLVLISLLGFYFLSFISGNNFSSVVSLLFSGAVAGFLAYNFPPAKIFMGDSGAYLLGFILAVLAIIFSKDIAAHLFIIGLPLFDGVYSNIRRVFKGKSIFLGDREHFYDKMLNKGFSVKKTLFISCALQIIFVAIGVFLYIYV